MKKTLFAVVQDEDPENSWMLLQEDDLVAVFSQFPFDAMFKHLLKMDPGVPSKSPSFVLSPRDNNNNNSHNSHNNGHYMTMAITMTMTTTTITMTTTTTTITTTKWWDFIACP